MSAGYPGYPSGPPPAPGGYAPGPPPYTPHDTYMPSGGSGGSHSKGGLEGIGNFLKKNASEVATAALSYKMGGKLGKVMAAGTAYDLANRYKSEKPHNQGYGGSGGAGPTYGGGSYSGASYYPPGPPQNHNVGGPGYNPTCFPQGQSQSKGCQQSKGGGLLDDLMHQGGNALKKGQQLVGGLVSDAKKPKLFKNGAVVQLISRASGQAVQIVKVPSGQLVFDALGVDSPTAYNAHFTVIKDGHRIMLHNNFNFIAISPAKALVVHMAGAHVPPAPMCWLTFSEMEQGVVALQSEQESSFVAFQPDGEPRSSCYGVYPNSPEAQFYVRILFMPQ